MDNSYDLWYWETQLVFAVQISQNVHQWMHQDCENGDVRRRGSRHNCTLEFCARWVQAMRGRKAAWPAYGIAEDYSMELPKINVPIRIVAGGLDKVERVGSVRAEVLGRIEGATSRTRVICCLLEKPERLAEEIKAFCDNLWLNACAPCGL